MSATDRPLRVLLLTQYFPPETGAAPARALHFARALRRAGIDVRVVTGLPNHPAGTIQPGYAPGRARPGSLEGIPVRRVWLFATPRKSAWTRLLNHLSFALASLPALFEGPAPDVLVASTPPLFHGLGGWLAASLRGAVFVNDCRDDWPHAAVSLGEMRPGAVATVLAALAGFFQRRATRVLVVTPGMRSQLVDRGLEGRRLVLLPNGADTELFRPADPAAPRPAGAPFRVLYAGTHGLVHGMEALLDAAALLRGANVQLQFVGDGVAKDALQRRAGREGLAHCTFEPSVPPAELVRRFHEADASVATTRAGAFAGETIPVKLFDALACGCPLVAAVCGDAAHVVESSGGGLVVEPGDGAAIAAAILRLRDDPALRAKLSAAGPPFVAKRHSRRALGEQLVATLADAHREARGRPIEPRPAGAYALAKRLADAVLAGFALLLLSPLLAAIALAIKLDAPGPALFRQRRSGRGGSEFVLLKFRSMAPGTPDVATHLVTPGAVRVTRVGRFLRRTSLDELPQLWNILLGSMALVGPRPALHNQDDLIALRQAAGVDALRPGLTGWAQINGRDDIPMVRKLALDREYLERISPSFDLAILVRTAAALLRMRGAR